jgi:NAD(P)-dependent dehydrogenase (short-subunit alcohol dehydrogenase family)
MRDRDLRGRTAVSTAAAGGIGRAITHPAAMAVVP